jgi:hypothetical protein
MDFQPTDKVEGVGDDFVRGGQDETPIKPRRNSRQRRIVVSAGTPTVKVTAGNEQFCAPWTAESPGGTVTTSAYNEDGKKRCLSAEGGSGDTRKKVLEQNKTFMRADRKSGGLDLEEIRAEAHKRQKKMGDAARAAEMTKEEVALEKRKGLAEKTAARRAASGQAGKDKHAAGEAERKAATGQAGTVKRAAEEAARQEQRELYAQLTRKTNETHGAARCAAEARKLNDSYFPGVSAHISLCALASFALAPPPA